MRGNRRKPGASGILTVLFLVGGALLLIVVGNLVRGTPVRRMPGTLAEQPAPAQRPESEPEFTTDERRTLERVLGGERR